VVGVDWIKTLPKEEAIWQKGMFAIRTQSSGSGTP
jgi:hypothetical protein